MPNIGLTTYVETASWGAWDEPAALLPTSYVELVASAGGLPMLLPPIVPRDLGRAAVAAVARIDGLVLTGGADIDPERYGAARHAETDAPRSGRDAWELALLDAALTIDLPVLAVCRGAQLLNVARGGTLHQHLPEVVRDDAHRPVPGTYARVHVQADAGSRLAAIVGDTAEVRCHHHQAIDRVGDGVAVCARAGDGTVEGIELAGFRFAVGVQWHPEASGDERLFAALVDAAASCTSS